MVASHRILLSKANEQGSFRAPQDAPTASGNDPLLLKLILTPAFQRLKHIRFLGAIDYRLIRHPNGQPGATRYSRYEHSIGVLRLARLYSQENNLPTRDRHLVCAAALLHDIGHPPLSHSMEAVFMRALGIDHHRATQDIICGRVPMGKDVYRALRESQVNAEDVVALVSGDCNRFDGFFSGPITFDTIEGVLRSWAYIGNASSTRTPDLVATAAIKRSVPAHCQTVDDFWQRKDDVYRQLIHSPTGILSDLACCLFLESNLDRVDTRHYFGTERSLFNRLPGLLQLLTSATFEDDVLRLVDEPILYEARQYYVDQEADFFARHDKLRYLQRRTPAVLSPDRLQSRMKPISEGAPGSTQGLF